MGYVARGTWVDRWYDTSSTGGQFVRPDARFRSWISPGEDFPPESGRYHLYVSWACPWAHRTLIYRALKGLQDAIGVTVVDPLMLSDGWTIAAGADPVNNAKALWQVYAKADPDYIGRATVPVLWDRERRTIVNNESGDIIRMLDAWPGVKRPLFRPPEFAAEIDALNDEIYRAVNNGVYRAGFATTQAAYEEAFRELFAMLDRLEERLRTRAFLHGEQITETRLAAVHDAGALRRGLPRPLQVQPQPPGRLSRAVGFHARALPGAGRRRDGTIRSHQDALLRQPPHHQSDRHHSGRAARRFCRADPACGVAARRMTPRGRRGGRIGRLSRLRQQTDRAGVRCRRGASPYIGFD